MFLSTKTISEPVVVFIATCTDINTVVEVHSNQTIENGNIKTIITFFH